MKVAALAQAHDIPIVAARRPRRARPPRDGDPERADGRVRPAGERSAAARVPGRSAPAGRRRGAASAAPGLRARCSTSRCWPATACCDGRAVPLRAGVLAPRRPRGRVRPDAPRAAGEPAGRARHGLVAGRARLLGGARPCRRCARPAATRETFLSGLGTELFELPVEVAQLYSGMLNMDAPGHSRLRGIVSAAFSPRYVSSSRTPSERRAAAVVDAVCERGECDFAADDRRAVPAGRDLRHARRPRGRTAPSSRASRASRCRSAMPSSARSTTPFRRRSTSSSTRRTSSASAATPRRATSRRCSMQAEVDGERLSGRGRKLLRAPDHGGHRDDGRLARARHDRALRQSGRARALAPRGRAAAAPARSRRYCAGRRR